MRSKTSPILASQAQGHLRAIVTPLIRDTITPAAERQKTNADNNISFWNRPLYAKIAISIGAVIISPFYLVKQMKQALPDACQFIADNLIKPVLNKVKDVLQWSNQRIIKPALKAFSDSCKSLYVNVLKPAYEIAKVVFKEVVEKIEKGLEFLYKEAVVPVLTFTFITVPKRLSKYFFIPLYKHVLKPAYQVVKTVLQKVLIDFTKMVLKNLHKHILAPAWKLTIKAVDILIRNVLSPALENIVKPVFEFTFITAPILILDGVYRPIENMVASGFNAIKDSIVEVYRNFASR